MNTLPPDIPIDADHAIVWHDDRLFLLDQRLLPERTEYRALSSCADTAAAITDMVVRGAPAIGITAAYGVVLAAAQRYGESADGWQTAMEPDLAQLAAARPTAVNLRWALERMSHCMATIRRGDPVAVLLDEATAIHLEDRAANRTMGAFGAELIERTTSVITHCNAGALATGGYGTALGVIRSAFAAGRIERVYADETRPWLQGSRLTAWELQQDGIPVTLLADAAAASRMAAGGVDWVIVGSDRIAANGDVANKIGTYSLALAARYHGVKVMVAAPTSTIDMSLPSGRAIPIERRAAEELLHCGGKRIGASGVDAWNPVFDVTPAGLVDAIVTELGVIISPNTEKMVELMEKTPQSR